MQLNDRHLFSLRRVHPWIEFNEYEGELEVCLVSLSPDAFIVYTTLASAADWKDINPLFEADLFLLRCGSVKQASTDRTIGMCGAANSSIYDVTGIIQQVGTDEIWLDIGNGFTLR